MNKAESTFITARKVGIVLTTIAIATAFVGGVLFGMSITEKRIKNETNQKFENLIDRMVQQSELDKKNDCIYGSGNFKNDTTLCEENVNEDAQDINEIKN